ncbi:MAG TPA: hypothetical protein PKK01_04350 [Mycobacterium sp.]|nr:hypothetical protein [Mycobacterium sp.]HQE15234.1 hypothetical protein [Mycobacterium sp.]
MAWTRPRDPSPPPGGCYRGAVVAVGTRHGKERQFSHPFSAILGARLVTPPDLDTDRFGTFTGERARLGTAVQAARAKAHLAIDRAGLPLALASEASYGPLPGIGGSGHEEILLFCDTVRGIEVLEGHRSAEIPGTTHEVSQHREIPPSLLAGLPGQALIVRSAQSGPGGVVVKGITEVSGLRAAVEKAVAGSADGRAVVAPDLRAHVNPSRRRVLRHLATVMARRLATLCPACATPGFGRVGTAPGLPCGLCATPTPLARSEIHACCRCGFSESRPVQPASADPAHCPLCNP